MADGNSFSKQIAKHEELFGDLLIPNSNNTTQSSTQEKIPVEVDKILSANQSTYSDIQLRLAHPEDPLSLDFCIDGSEIDERLCQTVAQEDSTVSSRFSQTTFAPIDPKFLDDVLSTRGGIGSNNSSKERLRELEAAFFAEYPFYRKRTPSFPKNTLQFWEFFSKKAEEIGEHITQNLSEVWWEAKKYQSKLPVLFGFNARNYDAFRHEITIWNKKYPIDYECEPACYGYHAALEFSQDDPMQLLLRSPRFLKVENELTPDISSKLLDEIPVNDEIVVQLTAEAQMIRSFGKFLSDVESYLHTIDSIVHRCEPYLDSLLDGISDTIRHLLRSEELKFDRAVAQFRSKNSFTAMDSEEIFHLKNAYRNLGLYPITEQVFPGISDYGRASFSEYVLHVVHSKMLEAQSGWPLLLMRNESYARELFENVTKIRLLAYKSSVAIRDFLPTIENVLNTALRLKASHGDGLFWEWIARQKSLASQFLSNTKDARDQIFKKLSLSNSEEAFLRLRKKLIEARAERIEEYNQWKRKIAFYSTTLTESDGIVWLEETWEYCEKSIWVIRYPKRYFRDKFDE